MSSAYSAADSSQGVSLSGGNVTINKPNWALYAVAAVVLVIAVIFGFKMLGKNRK